MAMDQNHERILENRHFLIVEDETFTRHILARFLLNSPGCEIHQAANGLEAVQKLSEVGPAIDCVISDINMSPMNGLQLLQAIRSGQTRAKRDVPVVLLTGHSDRRFLQTALELDVSAFVVKPASRQSLTSRVARVLGAPPTTKDSREYFLVDVPENIVELSTGKKHTADEPVEVTGVRLGLDEVHDNAVVTREVVMSNGTLLLPAGSILNKRTRARLSDLAEMDASLRYVWVKPEEETADGSN